MFIRKQQKKSTNTSQSSINYLLIETVRDGKLVRQKTILNLGHNFPLPEDKCK
jgi:hypothetical protein